MLIDYANTPQPVLVKLTMNLIITVPFIITVLCCVVVVLKLRSNTQQSRQLHNAEIALERLTDSTLLESKSSPPGNHVPESSRELLREVSRSTRDSARSSRDCLREGSSSRDSTTRHNSRESKQSKRVTTRQVSHVQDTDSSQRASVTIAMLTAAFIIAYGPYMILWIYNLVTMELDLAEPLITHGSQHWYIYLYIYLISTNVLPTFNSCIFPLIYFLRVKGRAVERVWEGLLFRATRSLHNHQHGDKYEEMEQRSQGVVQVMTVTDTQF